MNVLQPVAKKSHRPVSDKELQSLLQRHYNTAGCQSLLPARQQLPVYGYRDVIIQALRRHNVVVIAGETGSGKSTQIPQYLLQVT